MGGEGEMRRDARPSPGNTLVSERVCVQNYAATSSCIRNTNDIHVDISFM